MTMATSESTTPESGNVQTPATEATSPPDIIFPTLEEIEAERIHFGTQLSWTDLYALRDVLKATSELPTLTRDARVVVIRMLRELDEAEFGLSS
jgi:hypothetical protein